MTNTLIVPAQITDERAVSLGASPEFSALTVEQVLGQLALIQRIMTAAMKENITAAFPVAETGQPCSSRVTRSSASFSDRPLLTTWTNANSNAATASTVSRSR